MTFELFYWAVTFVNTAGQSMHPKPHLTPSPDNLTINYTVAGTPQEPAPVHPLPDAPYLTGDITMNMNPVLSWNSVPEAVSYRLIRDSDNPEVLDDEILTTETEVIDQLSIPVFPAGGGLNEIHYYVESIDEEGYSSEASNTVTFTPSTSGIKLSSDDDNMGLIRDINTVIYPNPFNPTTTI